MFDLAAANVVLLAWFRGNMRCFVLKCVKHEGTISTWAPLAALRHSVARRRLYPFSSFLPASLFNKVRPRGCLHFLFFLMHFDSAEMRFLCGDIRCSHSKDTDGSWLSVRRADKKISSDILKISTSAYISISHGCWRGHAGSPSAWAKYIFNFVLFYFLIDQLRLKIITSCKFLASWFQNICPKL